MAIKRTRGIDVSYYQGAIDWQAVKDQGVDWVILRAGFGNSNVDTQFVNNITGAVNAGFEKIGVYWFSYAHDIASAQAEVAKCLETIAPYKLRINLPVWFDWEGASYSYVERTHGISLTSSQIQGIAEAWCNGIIAGGYSTGIYSNKSNASGWFKRTDGQYLWEYLGVEFWYARYGANNETSLFVDPAFEETALSEHPEMDYFQFSDVGVVRGINSQRVDLNIRYENVIEPPSPPEPPTPEPEKEPTDNIEYVEIRDADREIIGIVDTAQSIIWHTVYYGVGDFEIYIDANETTMRLLKVGNFVTRINDENIGIIESIEITDSHENGKMITAKGRFAKSLLDRRLIYRLIGNTNRPTILSGNVETAIRSVVYENAIHNQYDSNRDIDELTLYDPSGISKKIVDDDGNPAQKQVSYENLLTYTDEVLKEYGLSSKVTLTDGLYLGYSVFEGKDRSVYNTYGNKPVIFSVDYDNLVSSSYTADRATYKNTALIGGSGQDLDRFYTLLHGMNSGIDRREVFIDASSINRTYKDESDADKTYTDSEYTKMLYEKGKKDLASLKPTESLSGEINTTYGNYLLNRDYGIGDIVTIQDNFIGKYANVRITEITEVQDENGYSVDVVYETE